MRGLRILSVFAAVCGGATDAAADALAPVYVESAFPAATRVAEAARLREALVRERTRAQGVNRRLDAAFGALPAGTLERVRAEKRRFLRERAFAFAETALARGDATGLGFAEQSVADAATINGMLEDELADWAVAPRPANDPIVLNVRDYGAKGDGMADDAPAFARACAAVRTLGGRPSVLRVPAGTYRLASVQHAQQRYVCTPRGLYDDNPWTLKAFGLFDNLANCLIEGDGPTNTFLRAGFHGQQVALVNCRNTRFRGFELSMERVPFLEGEIESWDAAAQACVVRLDAGTLRPDDPSWTPTDDERAFGYESFGAEYGKDGLLMRDAAVLRWDRKTFTDLGDGRWRIPLDGRVYPSHVRNVKPGGKLVLPNRTNAYGAFVMKFCTGCTAEDVWVRTSRSSAFWSLRSDRATFFRCRVFPLPGRSLSSNADGCFVDPGAFVWQCRFENVCDDGLNAKSYASWTLPGNSPVEVARADLGANRGGEVAAFFDPCTAQYLANRTFAHGDAPVRTASNGWRRVSRFTRAVDGLRLGDSWIFETRQRGIGTYVGACAFRNVRLAGCVIQTPCTLVEDVTFENVQDTGVRLGALGDFREGPPPYDVLVRNVKIDGCKTGVAAWLRMCDRAKKKWFDVTCAPIRGLDFVGLSVAHATRAAYDFRNAGDVRLMDCMLDGRAVEAADVKTARVENLEIENTKEQEQKEQDEMNRLGTLLLAGVCAAQAVAEDAMRTPNLKDTRLEGPLAVKADRLFRNRIADPLMRETIFEEARRAFVLRDDDEDNNGAKGNWRGEFWGKSMLCAARVADYLDDAALKAWIPGECARLAATADADGYIGSYSSATNCVLTGADLDRDECNTNWNLWGRKYTIWALLEAWRVTGDAAARATAVAQARHFIATVDKLAERGVGLADTGCHWLNGIPTMSVLKPMLLLYRETKEPAFLAFANRIVAQWDRADDRPPNFLRNAGNGRPYHEWYARPDFWAKTYESLSCLDGLVEHWRVTGSRRSLDAAIAVRDELAAHEGNQIGGLGICDKLIGAETFTYAATEVCDVIHWIRLNLDLFLTTGDKRFLDDAETSYFNAFLAGVDRSGSWGPLFVRDFARHTVSKGQCGYAYHHCCIDNAPRTFLDMASCAVTRDAAGTFHVNFFQDATVTLDGVAFEIRGDYPAHDTVRVTVAGDVRVAFRRPAWCRDLAVAEARTDGKTVYTLTFDMNPRVVSRQTVPSPDTPDGFFLRKWGVWRYTFANGEDLKAHLPAAPYATVMYGPLVLAKAARLGASRAELQRTDTVNGQGYSVKLTPLAAAGVYAPFSVELSKPGVPTIRTKACAYESAGDDPTGNRYFAFSIRF